MHGLKIAVIENEFGEQGIDDALMFQNTREHVEEQTIEMMNGAVRAKVSLRELRPARALRRRGGLRDKRFGLSSEDKFKILSSLSF